MVFGYLFIGCVEVLFFVVFYWINRFRLFGMVGFFFLCSIEKKPFSGGLVDQLLQPVSN